MKTCTKCGTEKPIEEFGKCWCKDCIKSYNKSYHQSEKYKEYQKSEKYKEYQKSEKYKECQKSYNQSENNKVRQIKRYLKKQIGEAPPPELVEVKLLINKTKRLCKTLKS